MSTINCAKYRHVYVPLLDVWLSGGPTVLPGLLRQREGRNLLLIPKQLVRQLGAIAKTEGREAFAAADTVHALKDLPINPDACTKRGITYGKPMPYADSLDVKFVDVPEFSPPDRRHERHLDLGTISGGIQRLTHRPPNIITQDGSLLIEGLTQGIRVEEPRFLTVRADIVNEGVVEGTDELLAKIHESPGRHVPRDLAEGLLHQELRHNQFISFGTGDKRQYAKVGGEPRFAGPNREVVELEGIVQFVERKRFTWDGEHSDSILGIKARDLEQYLAMQHLLLNPHIGMKFVTGKASSGKTLLAYACAVLQTLCTPVEDPKDEFAHHPGRYKQVILFKSNDLVGDRDLGFLPGDLEEKLAPFMESYAGVHDRTTLGRVIPFDVMIRDPNMITRTGAPRPAEYDLRAKKILGKLLPQEVPALVLKHSGHIRGMTFDDAVVLIDEAQNFTPYEMRTLIQRQGQNCVYVITGDPLQLDNRKRCSVNYNGLTQAIDHFLGKPYMGLINLARAYRGPASRDAETMRAY